MANTLRSGETRSIFYGGDIIHIFWAHIKVLWWLHSGDNEMHSIFPRSPSAFCGEYTLALMKCIQYFLAVHLRFVVITLTRISSQKCFVVIHSEASALRSVLWWLHSGAVELHSIFPRSPPAFCGEYTLAVIGLDSIISRSPPPNQHTTSVILFCLGARRRSGRESATKCLFNSPDALNLSRVMYPRLLGSP